MNKFHTITNGRVSAVVCLVGATLTSLVAKDKHGNDCELLLGYKNAADYEDNSYYFGSTVGRVANRLKNGEVTIDGVTYNLDKNADNNCLHGGVNGFYKKEFKVRDIGVDFIELVVTSPHLECGFPGNMEASVKYSLTEDDGLLIEFSAKSDKDTICAMTNHAYFTLGKAPSKCSIYDFVLSIDAAKILQLDDALCPTGTKLNVKGTAYDFNQPKAIGADIAKIGGYDNFFLTNNNGDFKKVASVTNLENGITLEVHSDCEGLQFYSGNFLKDDFFLQSAFCLEAHTAPGFVEGLYLKKNEIYSAKKMFKIYTNPNIFSN